MICKRVVIKFFVVSNVVSLLNRKNIENANDSVLMPVEISGGIAILIWLIERLIMRLSVRAVKVLLLCMAMQTESFVAMNVI